VRRRIPIGAALLLPVAVASCAHMFSPPTVEIVEVGLVSLGLTSGTVAVTLEVTNVGSRNLNVLGLLYEVDVREGEEEKAWTRLAGGLHSERFEVLPDGIQRITIPVPFQYRALGVALQRFLSQGQVPYRVHGKVSVRRLGMEFEVPFRSEGIFTP
jgi:LEA14-like dessication related protein